MMLDTLVQKLASILDVLHGVVTAEEDKIPAEAPGNHDVAIRFKTLHVVALRVGRGWEAEAFDEQVGVGEQPPVPLETSPDPLERGLMLGLEVIVPFEYEVREAIRVVICGFQDAQTVAIVVRRPADESRRVNLERYVARGHRARALILRRFIRAFGGLRILLDHLGDLNTDDVGDLVDEIGIPVGDDSEPWNLGIVGDLMENTGQLDWSVSKI